MPALQQETIVSDHFKVVGAFIVCHLFQCLLMPSQLVANAIQRFRRDHGASDRFGWRMLPCGQFAPVYIGTVATTIGAAVTTALKKVPRGNVESFRCHFPVYL